MKVNMVKMYGGILAPLDDSSSELMTRFKTGAVYPVEIKMTRNPDFHRKVFAFLNYCYEYWDPAITNIEHMTPAAQFDRFRKDLTILAGYYEQTVRLNGEIRVEAKSLSYGGMDQEEFEQLYHALINAALKHIFHNMDDQEIYDQLLSFF